MKTGARERAMMGATLFITIAVGCGSAGRLMAKDRTAQVSSDDPTFRLYNLLDSKFNGKLDDFYVLADVFNDPKNPGQAEQHVLRVEYNKDRGFGKLAIRVRTVAQLTPDQLKTYSAKQMYEFAETDSAKFTKTDPGSFGKPGDVYFEPAADGGAMGTISVTSDVQAQYERFVTNYLQPALEKKTAAGNGS